MNAAGRGFAFHLVCPPSLVFRWPALPTLLLMSAIALAQQPNQLFKEGFDLLKAGKAAEAAERFELGLRQDPNNATASYYLGEAYRGLGQNDKAKLAYERAVTADETSKAGVQGTQRLKEFPAGSTKAIDQIERSNWLKLGIADSKGCRAHYLDYDPSKVEKVSWTGKCVDGLMEGDGVLQFLMGTQGSHYECTMSKGYVTGRTKFTTTDGIVFDATFAYSHPVAGKITFSNGAWYNGEFMYDKYHGQGIFHTAKERREGTWVNGKFVYGKLTFIDGRWYEGEIIDRSFIRGVFHWANGDKFEGTFDSKNNLADGIVYKPDGRQIRYQNGVAQ